MKQLWQDIRANPLAVTLTLALWAALTWIVSTLDPRDWSAVPLLVVPAFVASFLIGRAHRLPAPPQPGVSSALLVGTLLFDLSILVLYLTVPAWGFDPSLPHRLYFRVVLVVTALGDLFIVLPACFVGWLLGREAVDPEGAGQSVG